MIRRSTQLISVCCLLYALSAMCFAQEQGQSPVSPAAAQSTGSTVPRLVSFSGVLKDAAGKPVTGPVSVTFSLYSEQEGGTALWAEMQTVESDPQGNYTVHLGVTNPAGLPLDLFTSGAARWLAVQPEAPGFGEPSRILLVGVPYALKAADADTLGGKPASAFVMAEPQTGGASGNPNVEKPAAVAVAPAVSSAATPTGSGTTDYIPLWTSSTNLGNSLLYQGSGYVKDLGIFELPSIGTATASTGYKSEPFYQFASAYNSSTKAAVVERFSWQVEPVGNNTASPSGKLNLLFASGSGTPAETGFSIGSTGVITSSGQVSASQLISTAATGTAPLSVSSTTQVANLNASLLGGMAASAFATTGANTFSGTQTINGSLNLTGSINNALTLQGNVTDSNGNLSANVIGGYSGNHVTNSAIGATIAGGGGIGIC